MGSMWIFLLFAGIAAIVKGKEYLSEQKSAPNSVPSDEDHEEIERRIKEILGVPNQTKRVVPSAPSVQSSAIPDKQPAQRTTRQVSQLSAPKPASAVKSYSVTPKNNTSAKQPSAQQTITTAPQIEAVMDDFSLEKAVIYTEIMQPKFKEY